MLEVCCGVTVSWASLERDDVLDEKIGTRNDGVSPILPMQIPRTEGGE